MNTSNPFLNALFNNLSSTYQKDNGMLNSNLFILFNAYANVFATYNNMMNQTKMNTYLNYADVSALEANFSAFVNFPFPPRLNTVTNGGEIYRSILIALYNAFLNGSTEESMITGLSTVLSYLTIDQNTDPVIEVTNRVNFNSYDTSIQLAYPAVSASGTLAQPTDFTILPSGLTVTGYNPANQTLNFTGNIPISGATYQIIYNVDHTPLMNTDWINLTNPSGTSPLPTDLKTIVNTFRNPQFSYWWNTYNQDGNGIQIIDGLLQPSEVGLVWRLPEKFIRFISPYNGNFVESTINPYNLSGAVYNINSINKDSDPDILQTCPVLNYADEIPGNPSDFYVRYSANNAVFSGLSAFVGTLGQVNSFSNIQTQFASSSFGTLDFFQKGDNFDVTDLFGIGTKNVWLNVPNQNGFYNLSSQTWFARPFSLHETILWNEYFENGWYSVGRTIANSGSFALTETVGVPLQPSEDSLMLYGSSTSVSPTIPSGIIVSGNHISVDVYDAWNSATTTYLDFDLINPLNNTVSGTYNFRFTIPPYQNNGPVIIATPSGNYYDTLSNNFIDTYFDSQVEANTEFSGVAINVSGGSIVPGHNNHANVSGGGTIYSKIPSLQNVNYMEVQISKNDNFSISFNYANVTNGGKAYGVGGGSVGWNALTHQYTSTGNGSSYSYYPYNPHAAWGWIGGGGGGGALVGSDPNPLSSFATIQIFPNGSVLIDGVLHSPAGLSFASLGTVTFNAAGDTAILVPFASSNIRLSVGANSRIYHYVLGNQIVINSFESGITSEPYYYQIAMSGQSILNAQHNIVPAPRSQDWHRLQFDLGANFNEATATLDNLVIMNQNLPFSGTFGLPGAVNNYSGISLHQDSTTNNEQSYFDNIKFGYYNPIQTMPQYQYFEDLSQDWMGSYLDQSAVLTNRQFAGSSQANFVFELVIKGLQNEFVYIIQTLVEKLKPAHTLVDFAFQTDYELNTTSLVAQFANNPQNWETGSVIQNIQITDGVDLSDPNDLPGLITISPSGT